MLFSENFSYIFKSNSLTPFSTVLWKMTATLGKVSLYRMFWPLSTGSLSASHPIDRSGNKFVRRNETVIFQFDLKMIDFLSNCFWTHFEAVMVIYDSKRIFGGRNFFNFKRWSSFFNRSSGWYIKLFNNFEERREIGVVFQPRSDTCYWSDDPILFISRSTFFWSTFYLNSSGLYVLWFFKI